MKLYWLILLLSMIMSGCIPQAPVLRNGHSVHSVWRGGVLDDSSSLDELLSYYKTMSSLPQSGIEAERQLAGAALERGEKMAHLRLALLYMLPNGGLRDSGRALAQLEALAGSKLAARPAFAAFIHLLKYDYSLQKDMQLKNIKLNRKLRQMERERQEVALELHESKKKTAALRRQIQQLKDIERIMNNR